MIDPTTTVEGRFGVRVIKETRPGGVHITRFIVVRFDEFGKAYDVHQCAESYMQDDPMIEAMHDENLSRQLGKHIWSRLFPTAP